MNEKEKIALNNALSDLNWELIQIFPFSGKVSLEDWNNKIAPKLSKLAQIIDGSPITARTFRLHESLFEEAK